MENFVLHDPHPSKSAFFLAAMNSELSKDRSWSGDAAVPAVLANITFSNVEISATGTSRMCENGNGCSCVPPIAKGASMPYGMPNLMQGFNADTLVTDIKFNNVKIAGIDVKDMLHGAVPGYWNVTTEYVNNIYADGVRVIGGAPKNPTEDTRPQCMDWANKDNFCSQVVPLVNDAFMQQKCPAACKS